MSNRRRRTPGPNPRAVPGHEPSAWLRGRIEDMRALALAGRVTGCPHLRPGIPAVSAVWTPHRADCLTCCSQRDIPDDEVNTCDRCRQRSERMHTNYAQVSALLHVVFGLCPACQRLELPAATGTPKEAQPPRNHDWLNDALAPIDGARIPGGCDTCDAFQVITAVWGQRGVSRIEIHHDDWCPTYRRIQSRRSATP
jgi:hypothetical protein